MLKRYKIFMDFPGGSDDKASVYDAGDPDSIPGLGRSGEGKGYPLQNSGLENSTDYSPWGHKKSDMTEPLSLSHNRQLIHPFTQHTISQSKS